MHECLFIISFIVFFSSKNVKLGLISRLTEEDSMTSSVRLERYASGEIKILNNGMGRSEQTVQTQV